MKLTEQQLAQIFQQSKHSDSALTVDDLYSSAEVSDKRLADVEAIANDSTLSASYQVLNQLHDWSQAVGNDIELSLKPKFTTSLFAWFKPTVATAAIITTVYFVTPQIDEHATNAEINIAQKSDRIMFNSSFEGNEDVIGDMSFESKQGSKDIIVRSNFS
ncbi:MAG: hypothetical protein L3J53_02780 [Proteobacteria bacterium]|nr:hypothetical protein [Pseudomonadota bacterium]